MSTDDLHVIKWYVDSAYGVHPDLKSNTGAVMTYGGGAAQSISRKQKLNTRSSTEAELVGADDAATMILWTKLFMEGTRLIGSIPEHIYSIAADGVYVH
ncbi:MAG: hypothetical protein ACP5E5_15625, partial [Acidobacteriaceae bacterium]